MASNKMAGNWDGTPDAVSDRPSRTKKKKAAEALQKTGEQLLSLTDAQLDQLDIGPELRRAVVDARSMTRHGARRRQLQYIGALMRREDSQNLPEQLAALSQQEFLEARRFKQVELWRDELKSGNDQRFAWLVDQFPAMDRDELVRLVSDANQSNPAAAKKATRALFRFLRQLVDEK